MKDHKPDSTDNPESSDELEYKLSESEWNLIIEKYKKNHSKLSPVTRGNISRLIDAMATIKMISTVQQANLIITLLLCEDDLQEIEEMECVISSEKKAGLTETGEGNQIEKVNEIIEQLRLLIIQYQAHEGHKLMCHGLMRDRR